MSATLRFARTTFGVAPHAAWFDLLRGRAERGRPRPRVWAAPTVLSMGCAHGYCCWASSTPGMPGRWALRQRTIPGIQLFLPNRFRSTKEVSADGAPGRQNSDHPAPRTRLRRSRIPSNHTPPRVDTTRVVKHTPPRWPHRRRSCSFSRPAWGGACGGRRVAA